MIRCDWFDLTKRTGQAGKKCHEEATHRIIRIVSEKTKYVNHRCKQHVPLAKPVVGELIITGILDKSSHKRSNPVTVPVRSSREGE